MTHTRPYRGRFAPSPTGPLHFGSLIAAVGSYLQARAHNGEWWIRIENIDPPREAKGATDSILHSLEAHGMEWDANVQYQHDRLDRYSEVLDELQLTGRLYACTCSRRQIAEKVDQADGALIYPGTCRDKNRQPDESHALRVDTRNAVIIFEDKIQGVQHFQLQQQSGDYVLRRADGLFSYQLAVAIDDVEQGMTEVVRGCDLLDSTARQVYLHQLLNMTSPAYAHLPVAVDPETGRKLSKQTFARALDNNSAIDNIWNVLVFLGQTPPVELRKADLDSVWQWAISNWRVSNVPQKPEIKLKPNKASDVLITDVIRDKL